MKNTVSALTLRQSVSILIFAFKYRQNHCRCDGVYSNMEQVILVILAAGALVGGLDLLFGNRFKLGEQFEKGFNLLGPTALSMVGILCLAPILSNAIKATIAPIWHSIGLDPAMLGGILAIDMGGYQMATALAENADIGNYAGLLVASTLGCTVSFTIPMSRGFLQGENSDNMFQDFFRGILIGLIVMPSALLIGGLFSGISFGCLIVQTLPIIILAALLIVGLCLIPKKMIKGFTVFAKLIQWMSIVGLTIGSVQYISGYTLIKELTPIDDAMKVVSGIGVVMLGSLPTAELLRRALAKPLNKFGARYGLNDTSFTALFVCFVSVTPALAMVKDMNRKSRVMNAAFMVCGASTLASHLGYTLSVNRSMMIPLLLTKFLGGVLGVALALLLPDKIQRNSHESE